jgi:hypothetical protein
MKEKVKTRFSMRLSRENAAALEEFMRHDPHASGEKGQALNLIVSRYFLYEKYKDLIIALEKLFERRK